MEHRDARDGRGQQDPADAPPAVPALAGPALLGVHVLLRLQGQQRRVQADGAGPVRSATLQGPDPRAPDRPQARRQPLVEHGVLQLLPGPDHDEPALPRPVRRAAAQAGLEPGAAAHGPGRQHPGRDRGGPAAHGARPRTGRPACQNLVLAGGVALNCVANGRLLREGPFENIWIQPAAGDAGGALGAALFVWHQLLDRPRSPNGRDSQKGSFLGPRYAPTRDRGSSWTRSGAPYRRFDDEARAARARRRGDDRGEGRRLVPRPDGVRAAGPGGAQHHRRRPVPEDAGAREPQDQVPRELPAVRPVRAARARARVVRDAARRGLALHAPGRPGAGEAPRVRWSRTRREALRQRPRPGPAGQHRSQLGARHHPRGLQRPRPDRRRAPRPLLPPHEEVSRDRPAVPSSSTRASTSRGSRSS